MNIIWHGQSCFQIATQKAKNNQVKIVIDPFDEATGLKVPSLEADILLVTNNHHDHNNVKAVKGNPFLIDGPGEYEIKEVFVQGISAFHDNSEGKEQGENTIYIIEAEKMRMCHLGDFGQKELTPNQLEKVGQIDILMVPVGGNFTIDAEGAAKIISQIEPKIVIPMHYQIPKVKLKLDKLDKFLKTMGIKSFEFLPKLSIKSKDLVDKETKTIVLKP
ncbi:MBL fold metallo-hydrolase [Patescibacteria group bacterium]